MEARHSNSGLEVSLFPQETCTLGCLRARPEPGKIGNLGVSSFSQELNLLWQNEAADFEPALCQLVFLKA